uniref:Uncharacterized protein n=1 Tax=Oryza punctata TaxID=4537 RepID=A0A0E0LGI9_ORYPU
MRRGRWEHAPSRYSSSPLRIVGSEVGGGRGGKGAIARALRRQPSPRRPHLRETAPFFLLDLPPAAPAADSRRLGSWRQGRGDRWPPGRRRSRAPPPPRRARRPPPRTFPCHRARFAPSPPRPPRAIVAGIFPPVAAASSPSESSRPPHHAPPSAAVEHGEALFEGASSNSSYSKNL